MNGALRIGIAGLGTVGGGVLKALADRAAMLGQAAGRPIEIVAVSARNRSQDRGFDITGFDWYDDPVAMANADTVDVLVELIGGSDGVARAAVECALGNGKHVVTANKALMAHHGAALAGLAEVSGVALSYEAAVAGGIPAIKTIRDGLAANKISRVSGILNGTCNYILSTMEQTGRSFDDVLVDAQKLGYAEANPDFDIDGTDTAHKLAILASLAFGTAVDFEGVYIEGIQAISALDIGFVEEFGYKIRLLGTAQQVEGGIEQRVHPALVEAGTPLASIEGVFNAVMIEGDQAGRIVLSGKGAGEGPTASAVIADLVDLARGSVFAPFGIPASALGKCPSVSMEHHAGAFYLRMNAVDRPGSMAEITQALAKASVSIERLVQRSSPVQEGGVQQGDGRLPVVFITHKTDEATMRRALHLLAEHKDVAGELMVIRIETASH